MPACIVGMSVYLNMPMKSARVVITNNGHRQSILHTAARICWFYLQHISMRLKLSQDCHNSKLYCLRCRREALKAQIIIFENTKTRSVLALMWIPFILQRLFKGRFYFFHSMNFLKWFKPVILSWWSIFLFERGWVSAFRKLCPFPDLDWHNDLPQ